VSTVPVPASVMSAYSLSDFGKAMTSSNVSSFFNMLNAHSVSSGNGPNEYRDSLGVSLNYGAAVMAKSLMGARNCTV